MADDKGNAIPFVLYRTNIGSVDLFVTDKGLTYVFNKWSVNPDLQNNQAYRILAKTSGIEYNQLERCRVDLDLLGAAISSTAIIQEDVIEEGKVDYYLGHCPQGIFDVKKYKKISIQNIYPGIDWMLYVSEEGIKYDFIVRPGADASQIKMLYKGADKMFLSDEAASLNFGTALGEIKEGNLYSYQHNNLNISSHYIIKDSLITFHVGDYDKTADLIIDPPLTLNWCTYYGGNSNEGAYGVTTDLFGNTFVTGFTNSTTFPTFNPGTAFVQTISAGSASGVAPGLGGMYGDLFILKFNPAGVREWATYYGGDGGDRGNSVVTDNVGNVYVVGATTSFDFPLQNLPGAYNQTNGPLANTGLADAIILKFTNNGTRLWATYYGSDNLDQAMDVAADNAGNIYITGYAGCYNFPLPPSPGGNAFYQSTYGGGGPCNHTLSSFAFSGDAFVLKLNAAGAVVWGTLMGGNEGDSGHGIALDNAGNIFITGQTQSSNFPCANPGGGALYNNTNSGNSSFILGLLWGDAFVAKFSPTYNLLWSTYCGGTFGDVAHDIAINPGGDIYVVGNTASSNFPIQPLAGAYNQPVLSGPSTLSEIEGDGFIMKFTNGGVLRWSTFYGGTSGDVCNAVVIDRCENIYISGYTGSANFPMHTNPGAPFYFDGTYGGGGDAFVLGISKNDVLDWTTYYGGTGGDNSNGITANAKGQITVVGSAGSTGLARNLSGAFNKSFASGNNDILLVRFAPQPINLNHNQTDALCFGTATGTATVNPSGGFPPYTYQWNTTPVQTTATATGLTAGTYSVIVSDASCEKDTLAIQITEPALLQAFIPVQNNILCNGETNGWATATQLGGTAPYSYVWSAAGQTNATITNIGAGTYTVTITDNNACTAQSTVAITQPPAITATVSVVNNILCAGDANGSLLITTTNGFAPFSYTWSHAAQTTASISGLTAGTYSVAIADQNGCTATASFTLTEPPALTISISTTPDQCLQGNGTALINPGGGTGAYTYSWSPTFQTTALVTGLSAGTYTATLRDNNGCSISSAANVVTIAVDTLQFSSLSGVSCAGACDGVVTLQLSGATNGPYNYSWNTVPAQTTLSATGLCAGAYTLTLTDVNGCRDTMSVYVSQPTSISATLTSNSTLCYGDNTGTANVTTVNGGTPPYFYIWDNGQPSANATGLYSGIYTVTITDANGCTQQQNIQVNDAPQLVVNVNALTTVLCEGNQTTVNSVVAGGTPGYTYLWNTNQNTSSINTGTLTTSTSYSLTVTDNNGCTAQASIEILVNSLPLVTFAADVTQGCAPVCVNFTNTTPGAASQLWNFGNNTTSTQQNPEYCYRETGSYHVTLTVSDNNGCSNTLTQNNFITVFPQPLANFVASPQPTTILNPTVYFTNHSQASIAWLWSFDDVNSAGSTQQNTNYTYNDTGTYYVRLIAINEFGCRDTATQLVSIKPDYVLYVPNSFTPNGDGLNDVFIPSGIGVDIDKYEFWIFDRWGDLIFRSTNPNLGWDGRANGGAEIAQQDTYVWKIAAVDVLGKKHQYVGHVNLIR